MNSVLVTGGAGYIGSHTCLLLLEKNYKVFVIDSFINSSINSLLRIKEMALKLNFNKDNLLIYSGDIRDKFILKKIFNDAKSLGKPIKAVIHFAALKSVKDSILNPQKYFDNNVNGTINLIDIMNENNCRTIVFSSSATVYGELHDLPIKEDSKCIPTNPYGKTKFLIENYLNKKFSDCIGEWRIICLRFFNPIGAHFSGNIGESSKEYANNIFPIINNVAKKLQSELKIYGNNWPTKDGTTIRDYVHVMDVADGHFRALDYLFRNDPIYLNLNIGTGKGTSVLELVKTFEEVTKIEIPFKFVDRREGDVAYLVANNQLSRSILNWNPQRDICEMCVDGWHWNRLNPRGFD